MAVYEVICGGYGCGKSSYMFQQIVPEETHKIGCGHPLIMFVALKWGSLRKHRQENLKQRISFTEATLKKIVTRIQETRKPTLVIDEWTHLSVYALFLKEERVCAEIDKIFSALDANPHLKKVIFICLDHVSYQPFNLYKKRALWNKRVFARANLVTLIHFGVPQVIKSI